MPGPIIEELPDDYDVAEKAQPSLRRGFLTKRSEAKEVPQAAPATPAPAPASGEGAGSEEFEEAPLQALRQRLQGAVAAARQRAQEAASAGEKERKALEVQLAAQARWPTSQIKERQAKASKEIDDALAEMRMSINDGRRLRSGEERRALAELRKSAEDVMDRVQKVADQASGRGAAEDRQRQAVAAFHVLPLTAKLRVLLGEKALAIPLVGGAFALGAAVVLGICLEVFSAWGCRANC
ncbi:unnamed protein product [Effrenium voratum]|nr:unnamed protein product [Effrenium voratum]